AAGLVITRIRSVCAARIAAWMLVLSATVGGERLCAREPAGFRMLAIIGALLWSMKGVGFVESQADGEKSLTPWRWLGFAAGWFGMRPAPFAALGGPPLPRSGSLIWFGTQRLILGSVLVLAAREVWRQAPAWLPENGSRLLATALALPG